MWTLEAKSCLSGLTPELVQCARERFELLAWADPNSGCWIWAGRLDPRGYGRINIRNNRSLNPRQVMAHRLAWELHRDPLPPGVNIDHRVCRNKWCVNPWHMALCTKLENCEQPDGMIGKRRAKTHCPKGHPYSGDNLIIYKRPGRICRACTSEQKRLSYWRKKHGQRNLAAPE